MILLSNGLEYQAEQMEMTHPIRSPSIPESCRFDGIWVAKLGCERLTQE